MKKRLLTAAAVVILLTSIALTMTSSNKSKKEVSGLTPEQVRWSTPSFYKDGRQRAQLFGDSNKGGVWLDRVKIPSHLSVLAHTHPEDELATVIEGTWYVGSGEKFDSAKLKGYPAGSFVIIPAGVPHFVATKETTAIVQISGAGIFRTDFLEK